MVDLFCGSGAATEALKQRHFRVLAAVDNDSTACRTYRKNHPKVTLFESDIRKLDPSILRRKALGRRNVDVMVVCAPCQPFSQQNRNRKEDRRAALILQASRFAKVLRPKVILFENVPGLASRANTKLLRKLGRSLTGYTLGSPKSVDAADYGVPQRRARCILLAHRTSKAPLVSAPNSPKGHRVTVRDAIYELPKLRSGQRSSRDSLHAARTHQKIALKRLASIPKNGGSRFNLPRELRLPCHVGHHGHPDVYGRMKWDDVAPTLTTGCTDITRGRFAHPRDDRAITLREAARLQTFPDSYEFYGNSKEVAVQIGNAVPVRLLNALLPGIRNAI